jgi:hypothetical protein
MESDQRISAYIGQPGAFSRSVRVRFDRVARQGAPPVWWMCWRRGRCTPPTRATSDCLIDPAPSMMGIAAERLVGALNPQLAALDEGGQSTRDRNREAPRDRARGTIRVRGERHGRDVHEGRSRGEHHRPALSPFSTLAGYRPWWRAQRAQGSGSVFLCRGTPLVRQGRACGWARR